MKKRMLAILLCLVMVASLMPMSVFATGTQYTTLDINDLDNIAFGGSPDTEVAANVNDQAVDASRITAEWFENVGGKLSAFDSSQTFAAGGFYQVLIKVQVAQNDTVDPAIKVTLNGDKVTVYSKEDFNKIGVDGTEKTAAMIDTETNTIVVAKMFNAPVEPKSYKVATVADLTAPAANANPDMNATVTLNGATHAEVSVAWNLINGTGDNYSATALVGSSTFVAEGMYNSVVTLKLDADTPVSDQFSYNGTTVKVYGTDDAFNSARKSYDGTKDITLVQFDDAKDELNIITMYKQLPHAHKWSSDWSKDKDNHWHICTFTGCTETSDRTAHVDADNNGKCDVCAYNLTTVVTHKELHITDLDKPVANKPVDFTATVTPSGEYGNCSVYWNKVKDLSKWSSDKLTSGNSYAAGCMYNTGILVKYGKREQIASDFKVTLNGENVPYYASAAEADKALHTYNGSNNVYAAYATTLKNGNVAIMIGGMFAKLPDTHTHDFSKDWLEDSNYHWKACSCGEISQKGGHFDNNNTGKCDVCGYVMANSTHKHNFGNKWLNDKSYHWQACSCGAISGKAVHFDNNKTGKCDVCGFPMANAVKPSTGDQSNIGLWIGAFIAAGAALVAIPVVIKKRKNDGDD